jgi:hypothetical protein
VTSTPDNGMSLLSVTVEGGDTRRSLEALRDLIARALDATEVRHHRSCVCDCGPPPPRAGDIAALSLRLADLIGRLDKLPAERRSTVDDLASRRRARRTEATGS